MHRIITTLLLASLMTVGTTADMRFMIKYKTPEAYKVRKMQTASQRIHKIVNRFDYTHSEVVETTYNDIQKAMKANDVEWVYPDEKWYPQEITNDPLLPKQYQVDKLKAWFAWDYNKGENVIIAILDSGVDADHPDLMPALVPGWSFITNNANTDDDNGHGTAVAGCAGAIGSNGRGVAGIAPNVKIMPIKVAGSNGSAYSSTLYNGLVWAADHGARVANMSFMVSSSSLVKSGMSYFKSKGGVCTVSAGNYNTRDTNPDNPDCLTVSATDSADNKASWSNYGTIVDVTAPGVGVYTTSRGGGYSPWSGTSFSAPITAGLCALVLSQKPTATPDEVMAVVKSTADDIGDPGWDEKYGTGRINAYRAVTSLVSGDKKPMAFFMSPKNGDTVLGVRDIVISTNPGVKGVKFYMNGVLWRTFVGSPSTDTFVFKNWSTKSVPDGVNALKATVEDQNGNTSNNYAYVTVSNYTDAVPPVVAFESHVSGQTVNGGYQKIKISATDNRKVANVKFYIDNTLIRTFTSAPYEMTWSSKSVIDGSHMLKAVATDDTNKTATAEVPIVVSNASTDYEDTVAPTVWFTQPETSVIAIKDGYFPIAFDALDNVGVETVQLYIDGQLIRTFTIAPFTAQWSIAPLKNGPLSLKLIAKDKKGNTSETYKVLTGRTVPPIQPGE